MVSLLYRYVIKSLDLDVFFHEAELKSKIIYNLLKEHCDEGTLVSWSNRKYKPDQTYDVVFDLRYLNRLTDAFKSDTVKILFLNASEDVGRNKAEMDRVNEVNKRRGCNLEPHRQIGDPEELLESIELADYVLLTGNEVTLNTYPEKYHDKIILVDAIVNK